MNGHNGLFGMGGGGGLGFGGALLTSVRVAMQNSMNGNGGPNRGLGAATSGTTQPSSA